MQTINGDTQARRIGERISSAFTRLLSQLRIPVPIAVAISMAIMVGIKTVKIQSYDVPRLIAAIISTIIFILVYIGCYRYVLIILRCFENLYRFENHKELESQSSALIREESSIMNPFFSTISDHYSKKSPLDYIGLLIIHLPVAVFLITSTWTLSEINTETTNALRVIESYEAALKEHSDKIPEGYNSVQVAVALASPELDTADNVVLMAFVYLTLRGAFFILYFLFLYRVVLLIIFINKTDMFKRLVILCTSYIALSIPCEIIYVKSLIQSFSYMIKVIILES